MFGGTAVDARITDDCKRRPCPARASTIRRYIDNSTVLGGEPGGDSEFVAAYQKLIDGLPDEIALLDSNWNVLVVNHSWRETGVGYGYAELKVGTNYLQFCRDCAGAGNKAAGAVVATIARIEAGKLDSHSFVYRGDDSKSRDFKICISRFRAGRQTYITVDRTDVTELLALRRLRDGFALSLCEEQAAERRRMAREIHDSTSQLLACIGMGLGQLKRSSASLNESHVVAEIEQLLGETVREIRTISYLAHPPSIEKLGLFEALRTLVSGIAKRTGLSASFEVESEQDIASTVSKLAIYRIVQEAMSNIYRHAHATNAKVRLIHRRSVIHAIISDDGSGLSINAQHGVGFSSMRDRAAECGGRLTIRSCGQGTTIVATFPVEPRVGPVRQFTAARKSSLVGRRKQAGRLPIDHSEAA